MELFPKGSEWRKWDLHLHTPESIEQQYGGPQADVWDKFIKQIAALPKEITVLGITDYLFLDGYITLKKRESEIPNIKLIIPNIEFRLDMFTGTDRNTKRLNYHVLFDPSVKPDIIQEQLLNCLSKAYLIEDGQEWKQTPTKRSLEELGQRIKKAAPPENSIHAKSDLEVGFSNITYRKEDIQELLDKDCFKGKYLTAIGYAEWTQFRWDQSAAEKRTLITECDLILTSQDDPAVIDQHKKELLQNKLKNTILHSSDAHSFERIGQTKLWIKADPTFAGLKQVVNEPDARVFNGDVPPNYKHSHQIISKLKIHNSHGWFQQGFEMELNRDLVSVIGGRGSGKSALVEMIAYGAGSYDKTEYSFINKASEHKDSIRGVKVCLTWEDGTETCHNIGELKEDHQLVRYLPQKAVEQLCDPRNNIELLKQIENVIFQSLSTTERLRASNFEELKNNVLRSLQNEKTSISKSVSDLNEELGKLRKNIDELPSKKISLSKDKDEVKKLTETLPILRAEDVKEQEFLAKANEQKKLFEDKVISFKSQQSVINDLRTRVKLFKEQIVSFEKDIAEQSQLAGISNIEAFKIKIDEPEIERILQERMTELEGAILSLQNGSKSDNAALLGIQTVDLLDDNLGKLQNAITEKLKETKAHETEKLKYQQQKQSIATIEKRIASLENEIKEIEENTTKKVKEIESLRNEKYLEFFAILNNEQHELQKLYLPLQESLARGTDTDQRLVFQAKVMFDADRFVNGIVALLDRTKKGNFRDIDNIKVAVREFWLTLVRVGFGKEGITLAIENLKRKFIEDGDQIYDIKDQLRGGYQLKDFEDWLYGTSSFSVASSIQFDGTDLHLLSPGQKGIVLLMLYLQIDKDDTRPLLIDQPEDNLDSLSVYNDLIGFFRDRKLYRQIIMVTHNPNLVVNTDTEQAIVANYSGNRVPRLEYITGSLEDQIKGDINLEPDKVTDGIIEHVCNILEGGDIAVNGRVKKYMISDKNFKYKKP